MIRRLSALWPLDAGSVEVVQASAGRARLVRARAELLQEGRPVEQPLLILDGWAARTQVLIDGRRQILDFKLPGDLVGHSERPGQVAAAPLVAVTPMTICAAPMPDGAALRAAYAASAACDETYLLNQIVRLGRMTASERLEDLLLEFLDRLLLAGCADGTSCALPLTQEILADALGLTAVHLNRVLQTARREKRLTLANGRLELLDPERTRHQVRRLPRR